MFSIMNRDQQRYHSPETAEPSYFTFVILIFVYAVQMDKLDRKYGNKQKQD